MNGPETIADNDGVSPPEIPDFEFVRPIGHGAFGVVWLARNKITQQLRAVKAVPLGSVDNADRAAREIAALIRYQSSIRGQHENLLPIYHVGQTGNLLYYLMEPADDVTGLPASMDASYQPATLAARTAAGRLSPIDCLELSRQLLCGLACLHGAGMAHRDVKPANCLFVNGVLQIGDFGLLTETDQTVSMVGTPTYMPPDKRMDARADVYAAGLIIYQMFTGLPAASFPRWSEDALAARNNPILQALNRLVLRACQRDPDQRFQDAKEMLEALKGAEIAHDAGPRPHRWMLFVAGVVIAVVAAVVTAWLWPATSAEYANVDFITKPFEAEIYLDGKQAKDARGRPYRTPCTILRLPAQTHHVVFKLPGYPDLDVGDVDLTEEREVTAEWRAVAPR